MGNPLEPKVDLGREEQIQEVRDLYEGISLGEIPISQILGGLECDEIPGAVGPFGSAGNPIPVNGAIGEIMYLKRLRCPCGVAVLFHRLGSREFGGRAGTRPLDIFETVCLTGKHWDILFVDMYHPRRSLRTPTGYANGPWDETFSPAPIAWGTTGRAQNFPNDLPGLIAQQFGTGLGEAIAEKCKERIGNGSRFNPPRDHMKRRANYSDVVKETGALWKLFDALREAMRKEP